jgi:hypothetical protein
VKGVRDLLQSEFSSFSGPLERIICVLMKDMELGAQPGRRMLHRLPPRTLKSYTSYLSLLRQYNPISAFPLVGMRNKLLVFSNMIVHGNVERRAFITSKASLDINTAALQEGDAIVILCGSDVSLLVRNHDCGTYKLIGGAYIDGIMDGEVMECDPDISIIEIC